MKSIETILMIDDDDEDREIFRDTLKEINPSLHCIQSMSALHAWDLLLKKTCIPDCIFVDLNMPIMNGFEFIEKVKSHHHLKQIPIVVYTTSNENQDKEKANKLGADSFITKPSDMRTLKTKLEDILFGNEQIRPDSRALHLK